VRHAGSVIEMDEEVVDGLPVLAEDATPEARRAPGEAEVVVSHRQVAAFALSTFAAGAATMALANRHKVSKSLARGRKQKRLGFGDVVASNSFLVDVHLLRRD
jgi:hypothetical protein